ncbi:MAG: GntR family transcriptional regulator [Paracoccaceae bacterium]|nr:GntR family transcriptional regulator [Paracoccaceae bacterium]
MSLDEQTDTAGESTYRLVRHDIIYGKLAPGTRLRLEQLKTAYSASINTLREILQRLSAEGFVVSKGQRGFEVAPVTQEEFSELAELRELIEGNAMTHSLRRGDLDWEGRVVGAHHKLARMERRMMQGHQADAERWKRYDREFHHALISACGSEELIDAHSRIFDQYLRYQVVAVIFRGEVAASEHADLLSCALDRDADRANAILHRHISACVHHTLENNLLGPKAAMPKLATEVTGGAA